MKVGIREYNRMNSKSSKNLMGVRPSISKCQKHSIEINKNIRMGSMSINEPTAFYESVFESFLQIIFYYIMNKFYNVL